MKTCVTPILLLVLVCAVDGCSHTRSERRSGATSATVVVVRQENNGSVNILGCTIVFSTGQHVELLGAETSTITVPAGALWVQASSIDPYHYPENPDLGAWRSRRKQLKLEPGEVARLSVEPKSKGSTYFGGWTIEREANHSTPPTGASRSGQWQYARQQRLAPVAHAGR